MVQRIQGIRFHHPGRRRRNEGGEDLFAHFSAIQSKGFRTLTEGQKVSFDVTTGPKGKQASNIVTQ